MKDIILPGEQVSDQPIRMDYAWVENGKTYATVLSLFDGKRLVPLQGPYEPQPEDYIVGVVVRVIFAGSGVDLNSPYQAFLSKMAVRNELRLGDILFAKVNSVNEVKDVELADARLLEGGRLISVSPVKVPRIIGKKNSMLNLIKEATGCEIFVGRNGFIWLSDREGEKTKLAIDSIRKIEREAHISGLTDRIKEYLEKNV